MNRRAFLQLAALAVAKALVPLQLRTVAPQLLPLADTYGDVVASALEATREQIVDSIFKKSVYLSRLTVEWDDISDVSENYFLNPELLDDETEEA